MNRFANSITLICAICIAMVAGGAQASPAHSFNKDTSEGRRDYAKALNTAASHAMNWYSRLLKAGDPFRGLKAGKKLGKKGDYPSGIKDIVITGAGIEKKGDKGSLIFTVDTEIIHEAKEGSKVLSLTESFELSINTEAKPKITGISRLKEDTFEADDDADDRLDSKAEYFQIRTFAYAWLALMDGVKGMGPAIGAESWADSADYSLSIGGKKLNGKAGSMLAKRNELIGEGGHLLRLVEIVSESSDGESFELKLISDWKGVNQQGKAVIAKVEQIIEIVRNRDGSWTVISVKERHLLPDLQPWQNLLC